MTKSRAFAALLITAIILAYPTAALSGALYHATSKAAVRKIMTEGINPAKFNSKARFGKMFYGARRPATAFAEKGQKSSLIRMRTSKHLENNFWDLRRPKPNTLRPYIGKMDLRGTVKRWVIGPKLGQKLGKAANAQGKAIKYRSAKNGGANIAVPGSMLSKHPRVIYNKTPYQQ